MAPASPPEGKMPPAFTPSRFMRGRRPHLFSDSTTNTQRTVTREVLSYHLETLTNQKDETRFETFVSHLCRKFISPNLRPQTGPTGGGDGKTDAETYPVTDAITLRWLVADTAGAHDRWAFAFSAKKDWRTKVKKDIASIVGTARNYPRIYFITNQFVPAKDSASVQDALGEEHGVPVIILDRTWILDRVFNDHSLDIAIDALGVGQGTEHDVRTLGPNDYERAAELDELEKAIGDGRRYAGAVGTLAEDCQRAALLARGLEKSRADVEGRYNRAIRIAREHILVKQELAATYNWAWTSYFWFDDPLTLNAVYDDVERLALGTEDADEIERLTNLMPLLRMSVRTGTLTEGTAKLEKRTADLITALNRIIGDTSRPNNALHARSLLLLTRVSERATADPGDPLGDIWTEYKNVLQEAEGLGTFPFGSFADTLTEIGEFVPESEAFDQLYDTMTDALARRLSEGEAAKKNSERGYQKLTKDLPYQSIRLFGKAVSLLVKEEYEEELINALIGSSFAYEQAGLPWAARNYALAAVSQQFAAFRRVASMDAVSPAVLQRYFWLEFRLARIPQILSAHQLEITIRNARAKTDKQHKSVNRAQMDHAGMLGALLLRSPLNSLAQIGKLPDALQRIGLGESRMALLFAMGHEETLRAEGSIPESEPHETVQEFFERWYAEGSKMELQRAPDFLLSDVVVLHSRVLGCHVQIDCANNLTSLGIGEAVLGTLEALLATSLSHGMVPLVERFRIRVAPSDHAALTPRLTFADEKGETVGHIAHASRLVYTTREEVLSFPNWLRDAVLKILLKFVAPADVETWVKALFEEENAFSRALTFSNIPTMLGNLFGDKTRLSIIDWIEQSDVDYPLQRSQAWAPPRPEKDDEEDNQKPTFGEGEPPEGFFDFERKKHTDLRVISPIDVERWNEARWDAALFIVVPGHDEIAPILGLAYKNREPAIAIFEGWRSRFGLHDPKNDLRIAILRGISAANPLAYAVTVGPNLDNVAKASGEMFWFISRIQRMYPSSSKNLDTFLEAFRRQGRLYLVPAHFPTRQSQPEPLMQFGLGKYDLVVREAWEIGEHDPDVVVLDPDDPPLIPKDQPNAPVLKALARKTRLRPERA
jgi:hypothetical protein